MYILKSERQIRSGDINRWNYEQMGEVTRVADNLTLKELLEWAIQ